MKEFSTSMKLNNEYIYYQIQIIVSNETKTIKITDEQAKEVLKNCVKEFCN